jgi:U3 small nucleolar RNA-associated protein 21
VNDGGQSVAISACGNFALLGSDGRIDKFNMQSGLHRGRYTCNNCCRCHSSLSVSIENAHEGAVSALQTDAGNEYFISAGMDGRVKVLFSPLSFFVSLSLSSFPLRASYNCSSGTYAK